MKSGRASGHLLFIILLCNFFFLSCNVRDTSFFFLNFALRIVEEDLTVHLFLLD